LACVSFIDVNVTVVSWLVTLTRSIIFAVMILQLLL